MPSSDLPGPADPALSFMYETFIFDLDGTLLQTLPDIRLAINEALKRCGYSYSFSLKEARALIGNGADMLVKRALKEKGDDPEAFAELKAGEGNGGDHKPPGNAV